ncbi:MAG: retropepsin-like domain-containing protein [Planctomycetes bacterium]|nr:retropepsin-like domain-containing protein [Planctomycetota bacterium]
MSVTQSEVHDELGIIVGRIRRDIDVAGRPCWTLFDSGSRNSYITREASHGLHLTPAESPRTTALGGNLHQIKEMCVVGAKLEGRSLEFLAYVVDAIGKDEDERPIDMLFGELAMQNWGIGLDLQNEDLDFRHYTTDFVEF